MGLAIGIFFLIVYFKLTNGTFTAGSFGEAIGNAIAGVLGAIFALIVAIGAGAIGLILLIVTIALMAKNVSLYDSRFTNTTQQHLNYINSGC